MNTADLVGCIYLAGCVLVVATSFVSAARGNWEGGDQGALSLLVCWFWPLLILMVPQYVFLLIRHRSFKVAGDEWLR